jgi:hypothetical protein
MEKTAAILISRKNDHFIVHSFGIFQGYGAYVAIDPFIQLDSNSSIDKIVSAILVAIDAAREVPYHFKDIERYRRENEDKASAEVRLFRLQKIRSTADSAKRYRKIHVTTTASLKSYRICEMGYDVVQRLLVPILEMRVKKDDQAIALTAAISELLSSE